MTPITPPSYLSGAFLPAATDRLNMGAWLVPDGSGALKVRGGVIPAGVAWPWRVKQHSSGDMSVVVPAGNFIIPAAIGGGGCYVGHNDADYIVPLAASSPSTTRHDLIVARVYDTDLSGVLNQFTLEAVTGAPSLPATPSNAIPLADVTVAANATQILDASITALHTYTSARGGVLMLKSTDSDPVNPLPGMKTWYTDTGVERIWDGSGWHQTYPLLDPLQQTVTAAVSTTSGGYVSLTGDPSISLTVKTGQVIEVVVGAVIIMQATTGYGRIAPVISGAFTYGPNDDDAAGTRNTDDHYTERTSVITCTASGTITVTVKYKSSSADNATYSSRRLIVRPGRPL